MYDKSDPRATLAAAPPSKKLAPTSFFDSQCGFFYGLDPQITDASGRTWITRGAAFVVTYTEGVDGGVFARTNQPDEYAVILPDKETGAEITTKDGTEAVPGFSVAFVPPGASSIKLRGKGRLVRLFTPKSKDLADQASNATAYEQPHPAVPPFKPWPEPAGGLKLKWYTLDVPDEPGRFGRIYRCTTFMVNYLNLLGPRDPTTVSPHHHDDFEQCSLALKGVFTHHLRWPWTTNMNTWKEDQHLVCGSPSMCVIPPPAIHTTTYTDSGVSLLVDIFAPPRIDFSSKPGWVLNEKDYPMPSA